MRAMEREERDTTAAARLLAAKRRQVTVACVVCGATVTGTSIRKFCSARCRNIAYRRAHRDEYLARQRERQRQARRQTKTPATPDTTTRPGRARDTGG